MTRTATQASEPFPHESWGFAIRSLSGPLPDAGPHAALVRGDGREVFVALLEEGREAEFETYLERERLRVIAWFDSREGRDALERALGGGSG
jgi:hypothetical protein